MARREFLVAALIMLGALAGGSTAQAAERQCVGLIGPETVRGDLVVPQGRCAISRAPPSTGGGNRVEGNKEGQCAAL